MVAKTKMSIIEKTNHRRGSITAMGSEYLDNEINGASGAKRSNNTATNTATNIYNPSHLNTPSLLLIFPPSYSSTYLHNIDVLPQPRLLPPKLLVTKLHPPPKVHEIQDKG